MENETKEPDGNQGEVLYQWSARKLQPVIVVNVALVFASLMAISHFLLHSPTGVKALALVAVVFVVPLFPSVMSRVEYRLTEAGLEKRAVNRDHPQEFEEVFRWEQLSHVEPMKYGFKFFKPFEEQDPLQRFIKTHISDSYSGEFQMEVVDREAIMGVIVGLDIPTSRPT